MQGCTKNLSVGLKTNMRVRSTHKKKLWAAHRYRFTEVQNKIVAFLLVMLERTANSQVKRF